ncbi:hypothetical protein BKA70DRAFT_1401077 [Coprinopsis sp. MPI-PUGE-AT-0042]|nr:hypothetical protein BKA70DRAFT_1401077 [Coprinopsis sp. MPI-PUGE-AT-0042]
MLSAAPMTAPPPMLIPPVNRRIVLEWYPLTFSSTAVYTEKERREVGIVPYHHPMTFETLRDSIVETFGFNFRQQVTHRNIRLETVVRGQQAWVMVAPESWAEFLSPDDVVGVFVRPIYGELDEWSFFESRQYTRSVSVQLIKKLQ